MNKSQETEKYLKEQFIKLLEKQIDSYDYLYSHMANMGKDLGAMLNQAKAETYQIVIKDLTNLKSLVKNM